MVIKDNINMKNSFYTSLILFFTLSSLLKIDYSTGIQVDFGGFRAETENSLVLDIKYNSFETVFKYLHESNVQDNEFFINNAYSQIKSFHSLRLNRYIFPQSIATKYLYPDYIHSIQINRRIFIVHQAQGDSNPFIS
jgi:hypothetical protein